MHPFGEVDWNASSTETDGRKINEYINSIQVYNDIAIYI
jgi:hypothetical protein